MPALQNLYCYLRDHDLSHLLQEWDPQDQVDLLHTSPFSKQKVQWVCESGHRWRASIESRCVRGSGCPYCSGRLPILGKTDLQTTHPQLAAEWDREKNGDAAPTDVSQGSTRMVWWRCPAGHSYETAVFSRAAGTGCPYCAGKKVLPGFNDLRTTDPALAAQWSEKNELTPEEITRSSHKKIWWKCPRGHDYPSPVYARVAGNDCPYCAGRRVLPGFNDLATLCPEIATEWYQPLNGTLTPTQVSKGASRRVWWQCRDGHVWQAYIFARTRENGTGCPVCAGTVKPKEAKLRPRRRPAQVAGAYA